jgi:hypothetical protein
VLELRQLLEQVGLVPAAIAASGARRRGQRSGGDALGLELVRLDLAGHFEEGGVGVWERGG